MEEEVLRGGFVNSVVRVGDTVRRIPGKCTPTIHRLLAHVRERGVTWVPAPLGYDDLGREILTFIPGAVPHEMPEWVWSEVVLTDVARSLREWHDATIGFDVAGSIWGLDARDPPEVICHNDFAPYNCVFRDERLVGAIDFDVCAPGPRLWDIAYTAYRFVPLMPSLNASDLPDGGERSPFGLSDMRARLDTFLAAYSAIGGPVHFAPSAVIASTIDRLRVLATWTNEHARINGVAALANHGEMYLAHARWLITQLRAG
jgi:aminoglycoside phosphotransferase (APT) family kinase protein